MAKSKNELTRSCCRVLALLFLIFFISTCSTADPKKPFSLYPFPPSGKGYSLSKGVLTYRDPAFLVSARPLDWRLVVAEYKRSELPVPFGEEGEAASQFVFIRVRLENRSPQSLVFNPLRVSAYTNERELFTPIEISDIYLLSQSASGIEARIRAFTMTCFDRIVTLPPGKIVEGYLVFTSPDSDTKSLSLIINDLYLGQESRDLVFFFKTSPVPENK